MKSILFFISFCLLSLHSMAQSHCVETRNEQFIHGNDIQAMIRVGGDLFWDGFQAQFNVPYDSTQSQQTSTIFAGALWMGGYDSGGNLKMAAQTYRQSGNDYWAGPINSQGQTDSTTCQRYDYLWRVSGDVVQTHIQQYNNQGTITSVDSSLLKWPGRNNPYFQNSMGFSLPSNRDLAPFYDRNGDNVYNPFDGDYPVYNHNNSAAIAEDMLWSVFNDVGNIHGASNGQPLGMEIQLTTYALQSTSLPALNRTVITSYKFISQQSDTLFDTRVGIWLDSDLGCYVDDYFGTSVADNAMFAYNADNYDEVNCGSIVRGYGYNPPVQSVKFLNRSLYKTMYYENSQSPATGNPNSASQFYRLLDGTWVDGTPLTYGGNGFNINGSSTNFIFPGDPLDTLGNAWTMYNENIAGNDYRMILSADLGTVVPGSVHALDVAYVYHRDSLNRDHLGNTALMQQELPLIQQWYDGMVVGLEETAVSATTTAAARLFPNPSKGQFSLQLAREGDYQLRVLDGLGRLVHQQSLPAGTMHQIQLPPLAAGLYYWQLTEQGEVKQTDKLVLQP